MDNLSKLIKTNYGPVLKFVQEFMGGMEYRVFRYKITTGSMNFNEISTILKALNIKFEDLQSITPVKSPPLPDRKPAKKPKTAPSKKTKPNPTGQARPFPKDPEPEVFGHVKKTGKMSDIMRAIKEDNEDLK